MRKMIVLLLLISATTTSNAQDLEYDCADLITYKHASDGGVWVSEYVELMAGHKRNGIGIVLAVPYDNEVMMLSIGTRGIGCTPKDTKIELEFSDLYTMTLLSDNAYNCKGYVQVFFGGNFNRQMELRRLTRSDIVKIRVHGLSGMIERELDEEDGLYLQGAFNCLGNMVGLF